MSGQKIIDGLKDAIEGRGTTRVVHVKMTREQLAYEHAKSVGWNEAIEAAARLVEAKGGVWDKKCAKEIRALDRSVQVIDD